MAKWDTGKSVEIMAHLFRSHFPYCKIDPALNSCATESLAGVPSESHCNGASEIVTFNTIKWSINSFQPYKSAGSDEIFL